ncbi:glutathione S-transferase Mu 4-like [Synchiropus picturatus]
MPVTLAYWDIRGLAQPIRLLLAYAGVEFEDKYYVCGDGPTFDKSCWIKEKEQLGLDFPNLPYLIDGDVKITQSNAIMRYVARKANLCGATEEEQTRVDVMENQAMDFRNGFVRVCYSQDCDKQKAGYLENLQGTLQRFSNFLGDRKWFAGDNITFVDFIMYELLDQHRMFEPGCLKFKNLQDLMKRFEALEKIDAYMKSDRFLKTPVNNKMAKWGQQKE